MTHVRILAFAGSLRKGSFNKQLVKIAAAGAGKAGAEVTVVDLKDYPLPVYDGDIEQAEGLPENAQKLKAMMIQADGFLIAAPEYNSSITAVLKNTIDWTSRSGGREEPPLAAFKGKTAVLMSASPGNLGGLRGLVTVRMILGNLGIIVLPEQLAVSRAHEAFDEHGQLKDAKLQESVARLGERLAAVAVKMKS